MPHMTISLIMGAAVLFILGVPIAVALGLSSALVILFFRPVPNLTMIPQLFAEAASSFTMLAVPLFILVGNLMERGTIGRKLIDFCTAFVGWLTGGLGAVNVVGSMIFGGISGSSLADTATFGTILIPRMKDEGYSEDYSGAITLTSSCLSVIIPPSILIVLAAASTQQSVSRALAAGLAPGVLVTLLLLIPNHLICKKRGYGKKHPFSIKNILQKTQSCWTALIAPLIILGTIFSGIVTPTEGAGVAVFYILIVDAVIFRKLSLRDIMICLVKTAGLTSAILLIATSSAIMNFIIAMENIPQILVNLLLAVPGGKAGFLVLTCIILLLIGMTIDASPACLIFTPLFLPAALKMGMDPSHFIILMVTGFAVGLTTPPYGVCIFSIASISGIPMARLIKASAPFYLMLILSLVLIAFIPGIALLAPRLMGM
ncbi:MAG: TRAP transporter large permease [Spirochaetales bacterium]|jgi:tripartite ATP-independent transporter DctM subunit|nr:TRAP transporter large permease [Spirochaetales bacterium]